MVDSDAQDRNGLVTSAAAARQGVVDLAPIMVGMAPFGFLAGIAAIDAGLSWWAGSVFSVGLFAGAAQLASLDLLGDGVSPVVIIATVLVINARFLMYSAGLAPSLAGTTLRARATIAYVLTDQLYAVGIDRFTRQPRFGPRVAYLLGGAFSLWSAWQVYTVIGALAGAVIPPDVPITFAIPLVFGALLVPAVTDRATLAAAASSGAVATLGADLPSNTGLLLAAATGILVGVAVSGRSATAASVGEEVR